MPRYEYKVVPAPQKGLKGKGVKGAEARFSHAVQELMNGLSSYGWEYLRAETLPSVERAGLGKATTEWRNLLVFRRPRAGDAEAFSPELLPAPEAADILEENEKAPAVEIEEAADSLPDEIAGIEKPTPSGKVAASEKTAAHSANPATDNGVEDTDEITGIGASLAQLASKRNTSKSKG